MPSISCPEKFQQEIQQKPSNRTQEKETPADIKPTPPIAFFCLRRLGQLCFYFIWLQFSLSRVGLIARTSAARTLPRPVIKLIWTHSVRMLMGRIPMVVVILAGRAVIVPSVRVCPTTVSKSSAHACNHRQKSENPERYFFLSQITTIFQSRTYSTYNHSFYTILHLTSTYDKEAA